jgi:hypothetical protein
MNEGFSLDIARYCNTWIIRVLGMKVAYFETLYALLMEQYSIQSSSQSTIKKYRIVANGRESNSPEDAVYQYIQSHFKPMTIKSLPGNKTTSPPPKSSSHQTPLQPSHKNPSATPPQHPPSSHRPPRPSQKPPAPPNKP